MNARAKWGRALAVLGALTVLTPPVLTLFGVDAGKAGTIAQLFGAAKMSIGTWLLPQLGFAPEPEQVDSGSQGEM